MTDVGINWFASLFFFFVSFNKQNLLKLSSVKYIYQIYAMHMDFYKVNWKLNLWPLGVKKKGNFLKGEALKLARIDQKQSKTKQLNKQKYPIQTKKRIFSCHYLSKKFSQVFCLRFQKKFKIVILKSRSFFFFFFCPFKLKLWNHHVQTRSYVIINKSRSFLKSDPINYIEKLDFYIILYSNSMI